MKKRDKLKKVWKKIRNMSKNNSPKGMTSSVRSLDDVRKLLKNVKRNNKRANQ